MMNLLFKKLNPNFLSTAVAAVAAASVQAPRRRARARKSTGPGCRRRSRRPAGTRPLHRLNPTTVATRRRWRRWRRRRRSSCGRGRVCVVSARAIAWWRWTSVPRCPSPRRRPRPRRCRPLPPPTTTTTTPPRMEPPSSTLTDCSKEVTATFRVQIMSSAPPVKGQFFRRIAVKFFELVKVWFECNPF